MQKLIERIGTENHSYRLLFQISRVMVAAAGPPQNIFCRVILQRDSKKYSSNYIRLKTNKQTEVNESINLRATLFYDPKRQAYQQKLFQVVIITKQADNQTQTAVFALPVEKYMGADHDKAVLSNKEGSKIQIYIKAERDNKKGETDSDTSVDDVKPKRISANYTANQTSLVIPQPTLVAPQLTHTKITERSVEESRRSIIDIIRFQDDELPLPQDEGPTPNPNCSPPVQTNIVIQNPQQQMAKRHQPIFQQRGTKSPSFKSVVSANDKLQARSSSFKKQPNRIDTVSATQQQQQQQAQFYQTQPVTPITPKAGSHLPQPPQLSQFNPYGYSASQVVAPQQQQQIAIPQQKPQPQQQPLARPATAQPSSNIRLPQMKLHVPNQIAPPTSQLKQTLQMVQDKLSQSMMKKSSMLQQLKLQHQQQFSQCKSQLGQLKSLNSRLTYQHQDLTREIKQLRERNGDLNKKLQRTIGQLNNVKQLRDRLISDNSELIAKVDLFKRSVKDHSSIQINLNNQYLSIKQQLDMFIKKQGQTAHKLAEVQDEKEQLLAKQSELLRKYQKLYSEFSNMRAQYDETKAKYSHNQQQFQQGIKQRDNQIGLLTNEVKHLQFMMIKPDEQLQSKQKQMLKQRLQKLIKDLRDETAQNQSIQQMLRNDIKAKKNQILQLTSQLQGQQRKMQELEHLWFSKQKSLSKALELKDNRIGELSRENQSLKQKAVSSAKFIEQEKSQLIIKMQNLSTELTRLKDVDQELAKTELQARDIGFKLQQANNQLSELKIQIKRLEQANQRNTKVLGDNQKHIKDIEGQLVRTNIKLACIVQKVFTVNPTLAQQLTQLKPQTGES